MVGSQKMNPAFNILPEGRFELVSEILIIGAERSKKIGKGAAGESDPDQDTAEEDHLVLSHLPENVTSLDHSGSSDR
jgi:hypothetical protein